MVLRFQSADKQSATSMIRGQLEFTLLSSLPGAIVFLNRQLIKCLKHTYDSWQNPKPGLPGTEVNLRRPKHLTLDLTKIRLARVHDVLPLNHVQPIPDENLALLDVHSDDPRQEENSARKPMFDRGLQLMSEGKVAIVCLATEQWLHDKEEYPIGMLDIGLPSHKTLFQLHAERLRRIQAMAERTQALSHLGRVRITLVIVTSPATDRQTRKFFADMENFGLLPSQVKFQIQEDLPCISDTGGFLCDSEHNIVKAPSGDGGVYSALVRDGLLAELESDGVQLIEVYSADNALARVADPHLLGHADLCGADICAKVVAKSYPGQPGSTFVLKNGQPELMDSAMLSYRETMKHDEGSGRLKFNWSGKGSFCFTTNFVRRAFLDQETSRRYHYTRGVLFSRTGAVMGTHHLAQIHDPVHLARNLVLMEVDAAAHFAPVRVPIIPLANDRIPQSIIACRANMVDTTQDARSAVLALHRRWVEKFGGKIESSEQWEGPEISPLKSYLGESLGYAVHGRVFCRANDSILQGLIPNVQDCNQIVREEKICETAEDSCLNPGTLVTYRLRRWEPATSFIQEDLALSSAK